MISRRLILVFKEIQKRKEKSFIKEGLNSRRNNISATICIKICKNEGNLECF